jgi:hypothetical protein
MPAIHWDWVATATVATPCILIALSLTARIGEAIEDVLEERHTRREIERQKEQARARDDQYRREYDALRAGRRT